MTTYGIDVSVYQAGIDWGAVSAAGMEYSFARATIGLRVDATFASHRSGAQGQGLIAGAYHFLEPGSGKDQADVFLAATNQCQGILAALDCEAQGLTAGLIDDFRTRFAERTNNHPLFTYTSISFWSNHGDPPIDLLWLAYYPQGGYPGDSSPVWDRRIGGVNPTLWQYGPRPIAGRKPVDGDAFRGTADELRAYTGTPQSSPEVPVGLTITALRAMNGTATVKGPGHSAIRVSDGAFIPLADGTVKDVCYVGTLGPIPGHPGVEGAVYGVGDAEAVVLAVDVTFAPTLPADVKHDVTLSVDNNPVFTVKV